MRRDADTPPGEASCAERARTQAEKSLGSIEEGTGRSEHEVRSAQTCSMSSSAGGTTFPWRARSTREVPGVVAGGVAGPGSVPEAAAGTSRIKAQAHPSALRAASSTLPPMRMLLFLL
jgi:hypothetical protein